MIEFNAGHITLFVVIIFIVLGCMITCLYRVYELFKKKQSPEVYPEPFAQENISSSRYNFPQSSTRASLVDERRKSSQSHRISNDDSVNMRGARGPNIFINDHNLRSSLDTNEKSIISGQGISLLSIDSQRSSRSSSTLLIPYSPRAQTSHSLSLRQSEASILPFAQAGNITFTINLSKRENLLSIRILKCTDLSTSNVIRRHSATPEYTSKRSGSLMVTQQNSPANQPITDTYVTMIYAPENEEVMAYRLINTKTIDGTSVFNSVIYFPGVCYEKVFNTNLTFIVYGLVKGNHPSLMNRTSSVLYQMSDHPISVFLGSVDYGKIGYSVSLNDEELKQQTVPLISANENGSLSKQLQSYYNCLPQIMLSILYNPDEKNVSITVVKCRKLAKPVINDYIPNHVSTFARVQAFVYGVKSNNARNSLVTETYNNERPGCPLHVLLKTQTQNRLKTRYPKYNETFSFVLPSRVPLELLPNSLVLEAEIFHVNERDPNGEPIGIGRVVLGQQSHFNATNARYWWKVFKNPGKSFNEWHELN